MSSLIAAPSLAESGGRRASIKPPFRSTSRSSNAQLLRGLLLFGKTQPQRGGFALGHALPISEPHSHFKRIKRYAGLLKLGRECTSTGPRRIAFRQSHLLLPSFKFSFISVFLFKTNLSPPPQPDSVFSFGVACCYFISGGF